MPRRCARRPAPAPGAGTGSPGRPAAGSRRARAPDTAQGFAGSPRVPIGADPVEDHPADAHRRVEGGEAVHERGHRPSRAARVHDEHHRRPQQSRHMGGRARTRPGRRRRRTVPSRLRRRRRRPPRVARRAGTAARSGPPPTSHGSRLRPGRPGGQGVVAGVDVVRADLVRADGQAARAQRGEQPGGHGRLAVPDSRPRRRRRGAGRSPFDAPLALLPGVHRVLDLGHLDDQVGGLDQRRAGASRPVMMTCWCPGRSRSVARRPRRRRPSPTSAGR